MFISEYFTAANSGDGFFNLFPECLENSEKLYIIKGGPGTGKSSFMRKIAEYAERRGLLSERIYCSSDPSSLDGLRIFTDSGIVAFADGTAPHVLDTASPGLHDFLLNLGDNWDEKLLKRSESQILELKKQKNAAYSRAYLFLRSAKLCESAVDSAVAPLRDLPRLERLAYRHAAKLTPSVLPERRRIFTECFGMSGRISLPTFNSPEIKKISIDRTYGGAAFLASLRRFSDLRGVSYAEILAPLSPDKADSLFFPDDSLLFTSRPGIISDSHISLARYVDRGLFAAIRGEVRSSLALRDELIRRALFSLECAGKFHADLEKIYSASMNFAQNNILCGKICSILFG